MLRQLFNKTQIYPRVPVNNNNFFAQTMSTTAAAAAAATATAIPNVTLHNGAKMPVIGFGTWEAAPGEVGAAVKAAIAAGYRHLDFARVYGNEKEIGVALSEVFAEGTVKRSDLFLTSKLWSNEFHPGRATEGLKATLTDLQLEYLDLYLLHYPRAFIVVEGVNEPRDKDGHHIIDDNVDTGATWKELEPFVANGTIKALGVSNFNTARIKALFASNPAVIPAVNQIESHPYCQMNDFVKWHTSENGGFSRLSDGKTCVVQAYSPLGSAGNSSMLQSVKSQEPGLPTVMQAPLIHEIASKLNKTPAQILLRWGIQRGTVVLAKSVNEQRIRANLDIVSWSIPEEDMEEIAAAYGHMNIHYVCHSFMRPEWGLPELS